MKIAAKSLTPVAVTLGLFSASLALAAQTQPIAEEFYVLDGSPRALESIRTLVQDGSLIVDHVSRQGFEVYGPVGTSVFLEQQRLPFVSLAGAHLKSLATYPSYEQNTAKLQDLARRYPSLAQLTSIGKSVQGRELWVMKISAQSTQDLVKPEVKLISSMHGDEITGRELLIRLTEELLTQYGKNPEITRLIDQTEIFILPSMNPDGSERKTRGNADGRDLNRSFPDFSTSDNANTESRRPPEVRAIMRWQAQRQFALSANYHGGVYVVNYPWDTIPEAHPLEDLVKKLSLEYAAPIPEFAQSREFENGITNGYAWYEVNGGMQDWSYYWHNDLQLTVEVSGIKWPDYRDIPNFYAANRDSMIRFLSRVHQGAGIVLSNNRKESGKVTVTTLNGQKIGTYGFTGGEFYKVLLPGSYLFAVETPSGTRSTVQVQVSDDLNRAISENHYVVVQ